MPLASTIALASGLAAAGAPAAALDPSRQGDGAEGKAHFEQFEANCLATDARLSTIAAKAEREKWTPVEGNGDPTPKGNTVGAWSYTVGEREYKLLVLEETWLYPTRPDLRGSPMRQCQVLTQQSSDLGALEAMVKKIESQACKEKTGLVHSVKGVEWRGPGYLIKYDFFTSRRTTDGVSFDGLVSTRAGDDQTLAHLDLRAKC